ncbi:hypothetical protein [Nostoc sp.]|uniref:hypothetical protein n=1 Tax=Nostoc sp. TaxID=1180 RepID=UPI002FFB1817
MAKVVCEKCNHQFEATNHVVTAGATAAGAATGAWLGSGIGIAMGPLGAIAGTIPGAVIGATLAGLGVTKLTQCPSCGHTFIV